MIPLARPGVGPSTTPTLMGMFMGLPREEPDELMVEAFSTPGGWSCSDESLSL